MLDTKGILRLIESVPSSKNEPFKVNGRLVRMRFSESGMPADECLINMLENLYK